MPRQTIRVLLAALCCAVLPSCATISGVRSNAIGSRTAPPLPPIPAVDGPLQPTVVYPTANSLVAARDSNFIFGSLGTGQATLTINGYPVTVEPNGSYLAFIPVPVEPRYELISMTTTDTVRLSHPVRLLSPRVEVPAMGELVVDSSSVTPDTGLARRPDEPVRVSVRAPANATVRMRAGGMTTPLTATDSTRWVADVPARLLADGGRLLVSRGSDSVSMDIPAVAMADTGAARWALLGGPGQDLDEGDRTIYGRPVPGGTYRWFFLPGTQVEVTGREGGFVRVRLDAELEAWVNAGDVTALDAGSVAPRLVASSMRIVPSEEWVDVVLPLAGRPPFLVEQTGRTLVLTLYGATANTDIINFASNDSLVRYVTWEKETNERARYTLHLASAPFGYATRWENGDFVLRVRRPPQVRQNRPLSGLRIAVDAGHPPAGATGPTGLYEAIPALAIAERVQRLLERRGATVIMTRTTDDPVPLVSRPMIARQSNAHALVSIHLNALPDGVNPFTNNGTGTYYFHPQAAPLARAVQAGMVRRMGLRDLGTWYNNLALARPTWMPAVLCEGAFMMLPAQEAAVRTPEFQEAYALGVVEGLEDFFRGLGDE